MPAPLVGFFDRIHLVPAVLALLLIVADAAMEGVRLQGWFDIAPEGMMIRDLGQTGTEYINESLQAINREIVYSARDEPNLPLVAKDPVDTKSAVSVDAPKPGHTHLMFVSQSSVASDEDLDIEDVVDRLRRYRVGFGESAPDDPPGVGENILLVAQSRNRAAVAATGQEKKLLNYSRLLLRKITEKLVREEENMERRGQRIRTSRKIRMLEELRKSHTDLGYVGINRNGPRYVGKVGFSSSHFYLVAKGDSDRIMPLDEESSDSYPILELLAKWSPEKKGKYRFSLMNVLRDGKGAGIGKVANLASRFFPDDRKYHIAVVPPGGTMYYFRNTGALVLTNVPTDREYVLREGDREFASFSLPLTRYNENTMLTLAIGLGLGAVVCAAVTAVTGHGVLKCEQHMFVRRFWICGGLSLALLIAGAVMFGYAAGVIRTQTAAATEDVGEMTMFIVRWSMIGLTFFLVLAAGVLTKRKLR